MKASNKILHEKQYAERILEITGDTMFFVYKDGTCLDFKPNRPDFYIKEEEVVGKNIFHISLWRQLGKCTRNLKSH